MIEIKKNRYLINMILLLLSGVENENKYLKSIFNKILVLSSIVKNENEIMNLSNNY